MRKILDMFGSSALNVLFWELLALAVIAVLWRADFVFGDEEIFLRTICKGIPVPLQIIPKSGRCCPFSHCDCNFTLLLPGCLKPFIPQVIYAVKSVVLAVTLYVLALFTTRERTENRTGRLLPFLTVLLFSVAPSVMHVSCWNIFPEQRMFLLLAVFALSVYNVLDRDLWRWYALAGAATLIVLGYKETSFILVGVFSATCLIGGWRRFSFRVRAFFACLLCAAAVYCVFYWFTCGRVSSAYRTGHMVGMASSVAFYLTQPEIALATFLALVRGGFFVCGRSGRHLFWDALLFAGTAFVLAYVWLQLTSPYNYYQSPAYVFVLPVFLHWLLEAARRFRFAGAAGVVLLLGLVAYDAARTVPTVLGHLERRRLELPAMRALSADADLDRIYYWYPVRGVYEDYHRYLFGVYAEYVGLDAPISDVKDVRLDLDENEVEVIPTCYNHVDVPLLKERGVEHLEWLSVVHGPVTGSRPKRCGRSGADVHAGDRGVDGLYSVCDGWALAQKKVTIRIGLSEAVRGRPMTARLVAGSVTSPSRPNNPILVSVNGQRIYRGDAWLPISERRFPIPETCTRESDMVVCIESDFTVCPAEEGMSSDTRNLGAAFGSLTLFPQRGDEGGMH